MLIAGARPNFMKVAPILRELNHRDLVSVLVHTGQHYDAAMSDVFFRDLEIPPPDHHLGVGSGSHAVQTARLMEAFEPVLRAHAPDWVLVVGDVNSTLAAALVTSKLKEELGCRIAHVEAGLRSHDWRMPEEVNRVLTDRLSDLLLIPSQDAYSNLIGEGIAGERIRFVGNVMIDSLLHRLSAARERTILDDVGVQRKKYAVATIHRPSNVDDSESLTAALEALGAVAREVPVVLPLHPRTAACVADYGLQLLLEPLVVTESLGYLDMLALLDGAVGVLTDSGGIQEETTALGVPCVTLREQTERPVTITEGTNRLAPWPLTPAGVVAAFGVATANGIYGPRCPEGWDGKASERIVDALQSLH
jgi:UDP-N-acetylglucosamine 2-epimerase (non-hydrolysing)